MTTLNLLSERLKMARTKKGLSQAKLAQLAGDKQSKIAALETGRNKSSTNIATLAAILEVNPIWLETGKGEIETFINQNIGAQFGDNTTIGSSNNFSVTAYSGSLNTDPATDMMPDHSMSPHIPQGSELWVNRQQCTIESGKIYMIEWNGKLCVLRLTQQLNGDITLTPDNPALKSQDVSPDQIHIIGRVTAWKVTEQ